MYIYIYIYIIIYIMISHKIGWIRLSHVDPHPCPTQPDHWAQRWWLSLRPRPETERLRIQSEGLRILFLGEGLDWSHNNCVRMWVCPKMWHTPNMDDMIIQEKSICFNMFWCYAIFRAIWGQKAHSTLVFNEHSTQKLTRFHSMVPWWTSHSL